MKINLILLPFEENARLPPISLGYIGVLLKNQGYEVKLIDLNLETNIPDSDINLVASTTEDYYNCPLLNIESIIDCLKKIKDLRKPIILIGPHGTSTPEHFQDYADYIVIGEPEITSLELIKALTNKKDIKKVRGIHFRYKSKFITTSPRPPIYDLDSLPFPDRSLMKINEYVNPVCKNHPFTVIITSRGCPYQCTFCFKGVYGTIWRKRSPENVVNELIEIKRKYNIKEIWFRDDLFLLDKPRIIKICDGIIKNNLDLSWSCQARVDNLDYETLNKMKQAGCYTLSLGIESASQKILNNIKKGINLEKVINAVNLCKKLGIRTRGYFIIGFPGETKETINESLGFAKSLDLDYFMISLMTPYPNTEIFENAFKEGIIKERSWESSLKYAGQIHTEFTFEELIKMKRKLYSKYYLRYSYIIKRLTPSKIDILYHGLIPFIRQFLVKKFRGKRI